MTHRPYPKELVLKDCSEVCLRPLEADDDAALRRFFVSLPKENVWYLKENPCDAAIAEKWIAKQQSGETLCILALHDDQIVAQASLQRDQCGGRQHIGRIRVVVATDFRRRQLGTWMIFDLIRRAMEMGLEKIRTDFVVGLEDRAIEAVAKLDFVPACVLKDYFKDQQGNYYDCQIMMRHLHQQWSDF